MEKLFDSESLPLDSDDDFTPEERLAIRRFLRKLMEREHREAWAWEKARIVVPLFVTIVVGLATAIGKTIDWALKHLNYTP